MKQEDAIGVVGLGRMGWPLCENLRDHGHRVVGYDLDAANRNRLATGGMEAVGSLDDLCARLASPRHIILMVPAGAPVDAVLAELLPLLAAGDVVIDAGNSHYGDSLRRGASLSEKGVGFLDVGMSGGMSGARHGACLTIGGERRLFEQAEHLFRDIACEKGYLYVGPSGWGHLVKTIHNGIEYGFLQAIAEGLATIQAVADEKGDAIDLVRLCEVWGHGSIITSRLLNDTVEALKLLREVEVPGKVGGGETGRWAQEIAKAHQTPVPVLTASLDQRLRSQEVPDFSGKIIAAIRNVFGGHSFGS
ncbi:phosphogluconate dehydrogenase (NAD(+)-dependent, decarboxylating) [Geomesophilobacter sediminis]|uniref:Decarboxylating 6-phosphogluconate dehydrogenase n=1 Tax=Geomesophilobacter sediminis TaxID=2798584 RepID=A0A8J7IW85_9BACT|nr:decarboxylating 6-phosphogluconate dehydrogenase [Geomesophilobacter sediminis]MBJ6723677.1 decarboxylating 6-phosphogluconate dehydrogenase [Geomesophilobacter sediminis]